MPPFLPDQEWVTSEFTLWGKGNAGLGIGIGDFYGVRLDGDVRSDAVEFWSRRATKDPLGRYRGNGRAGPYFAACNVSKGLQEALCCSRAIAGSRHSPSPTDSIGWVMFGFDVWWVKWQQRCLQSGHKNLRSWQMKWSFSLGGMDTSALMWLALIMSISATGVSLGLAGYAGWYRGGGWMLVLPSLLAVLGAHWTPALFRSLSPALLRVSIVVWAVCIVMVMYGHAAAFLAIQHQGGQQRTAEVMLAQVTDEPKRKIPEILTEQAKVQADLSRAKALLASRVAIGCEDGCADLRGRVAGLSGRLVALQAEVAVAESWQASQNDLMAQQKAVGADPVALALHRWLGWSEEMTNFLAALGNAIILEGLACLGWWVVLAPRDSPRVAATSGMEIVAVTPIVTPKINEAGKPVIKAKPEVTLGHDQIVMQLVTEVQEGKLKPTVNSVMAYLSCGRLKASEVAKALKVRLAALEAAN